MATFENTRSETNDRLFGANLGPAINSVVGRVSAWNDARVTRKALMKLTDRELDDIGLSRGDIYNIR